MEAFMATVDNGRARNKNKARNENHAVTSNNNSAIAMQIDRTNKHGSKRSIAWKSKR